MIDEMIQQSFFKWIIQRRDERGWNDAELSQAVGISPSYLSLVMNSQRNITFDFAMGVARAFSERPEIVLRLAGLLPPSGGKVDDLSEDEAEWLEVYRSLEPDQRKTIFGVVAGWRDRLKRRG